MQRGLRSGPSREVPLATAWAVVFVLLLALRVVFLMAEGPPPDSRTWLQLGSLVLLLLLIAPIMWFQRLQSREQEAAP